VGPVPLLSTGFLVEQETLVISAACARHIPRICLAYHTLFAHETVCCLAIPLMDRMLGYCGLDCSCCPIHLATLEADPRKQFSMRTDIARICRERYGLSLEAKDVGDCDGCRSENLFVTCSSCQIRQCVRGKHIASCAFCEEYACERLHVIFLEDPVARDRLETIRTLP
jgi:hypothetical protein